MPSIGTLGWLYIDATAGTFTSGTSNYIAFYKDATTVSGSNYIKSDEMLKQMTIVGQLSASVLSGTTTYANAVTSSFAIFGQYVSSSTYYGSGNNLTFAYTTLSASQGVSGSSAQFDLYVSSSTYYGDGSKLTGIAASTTPGGYDTYLQFNKSGTDFSGSADLTFDYTLKHLTLTGQLTASVVSSSNFYGNDANLTSVVYYGTGSTAADLLYYLNSNGGWDRANANGTGTLGSASAGNEGLLGIALGTDPASHGMHIYGEYTLTNLSGSFITGSALYVATGSATGDCGGTIATAAPYNVGNYVRGIGHCTTGNTIYLNPDKVWVEIT